MSNNIFSSKRFALLCKQNLIHNTDFLLLSIVAYIGAIFIVLSISQVGDGFRPHNVGTFQAFLVGFVTIFGILYAGHAFPAFRNKESTINYLMVPASVLEKFVFELINRICITLLVLPLLYWITFHLQGYSFTLFTDEVFQPVGPQYLVTLDTPEGQSGLLIYTLITAAVLLVFVLAFTGAAMFSKQPLVKSLFSLAVIVIFFVGYSYIVLTHLGVEEYNPPDTMVLLPMDDVKAFRLITIGLIVTNVVMLFVAFRKLKEREV